MNRNFSRRSLALTGSIGLAALASCTTRKAEVPPNFIIFLTDDLGYGDLTCYGNPINSTPSMDKFALQGALLTNCHSAGTVCSPSRAGILTGRNPYRSGFSGITNARMFLSDGEVTIAELLKTKGYQTAFFGKWHLSVLEDSLQPDPGDQGFDYWLATSHNSFEGPQNPQHFIRNGEKIGTLQDWFCDIIVRESLEWLNRIDRKKPYLLVVCSHEPHSPLVPPDSLKIPFLNPDLMPLIRSMNYGGVDREGKYIQENAANYYGTIKQLDNAFGRFIDGVDQNGFGNNTLIYLTSDNGPEHPVNLEESKGEWSVPIRDNCYGTPGPFRGMKRYPYEGGHRVPGLVRWSGKIPPGSRSDQLFTGVDILPTFCQLAGIEVPGDRVIDGNPGFNAFLNQTVDRKEPYLWIFPTHADTHFRMPHMAMRSGDFVLLGWFPPKTAEEKLIPWMTHSVPVKFELYNIIKDPGETTDLASGLPELVQRMSGEMITQWTGIQQEYKEHYGIN